MARPLFLNLSLLLVHLSFAALIEQTWRISNSFIRPDGVEKLSPVVNLQFPGPTLRGIVGDRVRITIVNELPAETTTIHWHGIKQTGTPWADGVPQITQYGIRPLQSYVYEFVLDAPGTVWWHSHSAFQKSSLQGFIITDGDQSEVGVYPEFNLLLSDWYHTSGTKQIAGLLEKEFRWVGDPQSILINGRGHFPCNQTKLDCIETSQNYIDVRPGTTYRVRIVGAASLAFLNLAIEGHELEMIEVETTLVNRFKTRYLDVSSGQSYSALLRTKTKDELKKVKNNNGLFWIQANVRHRNAQARGLAILRYSNARGHETPKRALPWTPGRDDVAWSVRHARRFRALKPSPLPEPSRILTFLGTQNTATDGRLKWAVNNISFVERPIPLLHSLALGLKTELREYVRQKRIPTPFDYNKTLPEAGLSTIAKTGTHVIRLRRDEVVDFVFQNTRALNGADEVHPWHFHLHNFWVLAIGDEHSAWSKRDIKRYDTRTAVSRNTFSLLPGGWTAIRIRADNPGMAFFHCHILSHLVMGMGFVVQIGTTADVPPAPPGAQLCISSTTV